MRFVKVLCGVFISCAILCTVVVGVWKYGVYLPGQTVNDLDVSWRTPYSVRSEVIVNNTNPVTLLIDDQKIELYSVVSVDSDEDDYFMDFTDWIRRVPLYVDVTVSTDYDAVRDYLGAHIQKHADAYIECVNGTWILHGEVKGFDIDVDSVIAELQKDAITPIKLSEFQYLPNVTSDSLQSEFDNVKWLNDFTFGYASGVSLLGTELSEFVIDGELQLPDGYIKDFVKSATDVFNTTEGSVIVHNPVTNSDLTIDKKTLGKTVAIDDEVAYVTDKLTEHESEYNRTPKTKGYDEIGDTYLLVSIDDQHLWYIKDSELYTETDVVTGRKGAHDTPKGAYYISECIPGKNLRGDDYVTWVNKWMRLTNSGIGLHDAYWRGSFGNNIYTYNGSHGCINLPAKYAAELYEEAFVGMPVFIF
ncbi:MAG: L,D-transpeptidase [Lachnospiraceae bacterium]|nr:L,D-transpeptidase [Lachnospiraceae bacterium]